MAAAALGFAALIAKHAANSQTLGESSNTAMDNFSRFESLGFFNANESSPDRFSKLKKHNSSKF